MDIYKIEYRYLNQLDYTTHCLVEGFDLAQKRIDSLYKIYEDDVEIVSVCKLENPDWVEVINE